MTAETVFTARPYAGEADLQPSFDLIVLCDAADQTEPLPSATELQRYIEVPDRDQARDIRLWEDRAGQLVGYAMLWIPQGGAVAGSYLYYRVHPAARPAGLGEQVLAWAAERAREVGRERGLPANLRASARDHDRHGRGLLEGHGFQAVRYFFKMARPLTEPIPDPRLPPGFTLQRGASDAEVERWVAMYDDAFRDHWDFHPVSVEDRRHWLTDPNYRPAHDLIAVAPDGTFAAFCYCVVDPEGNARSGRREGLIDTLGTRRAYRHQGLGTALLRAALQQFQADGLDTATLGVDADNPTGAPRLYESVGFRTVATDIAYNKPL